jgi:hypothetical protein
MLGWAGAWRGHSRRTPIWLTNGLSRCSCLTERRGTLRRFQNAYTALSFRGTCHEYLTFLVRGEDRQGVCVTSNFHFPKFTLITGSNSVNSTSLRCDHCRDELGSRVLRYWLMRFCSTNCVDAYQKRLSPGARDKIVKLDVDHTSLKIAS